ncbi:MAG TPA: hypothetical protein VML94_06095 [Thermoplasmata archaeon]|nr:hypothetical protein [Thermoplasmata archaeon]
MRSRSSRSTGRARRTPPPRPAVVAYLLPAIVGGGLGDVEEVLAAGRRLARSGVPLVLYRRPGRPLPRGVDGPWAWPTHRRVDRLVPDRRAALTITPAWGVSAAPAGPAPLGGPGPWSEEVVAIERAHGADRTIHASLEEFARTLPMRVENRERLREGGVRSRALADRLARARAAGDVATFDRAYRRFRAFDRPNVLHLFATFRPNRSFARAFPEAVQTGPLWPARYSRASSRAPRSTRWVWYASPASAESIAPDVDRGLAATEGGAQLFVRTPRPWRPRRWASTVRVSADPLAPGRWRRRFRGADVRIVTGSRSLLEAIEVGGPFLYFNGVLGAGSARRRHRPEKIAALLALAREARWPSDVRRDLADFASGRRVAAITERVARRAGGWGRPRPALRLSGFPPGFDDAGTVLVRVARALARPGASAPGIVARLRAGENP